jgi:putative DNA primase/helicase
VGGLREYQARGLDEPDSVRSATASYHRDNDDIGRFIAECCTTDDAKARSTTTQLFDAWVKWCAQEGINTLELSMKMFGKALDAKGHPVTEKTRDARWRTGIRPAESEV